MHLLGAFVRLGSILDAQCGPPFNFMRQPCLQPSSTVNPNCLACCRALAQSPPMPLAPALQAVPWGAHPPTGWRAAPCRQAAAALRRSPAWTRAQAAREPMLEVLVLTVPTQPRLAQVNSVHEHGVFLFNSGYPFMTAEPVPAAAVYCCCCLSCEMIWCHQGLSLVICCRASQQGSGRLAARTGPELKLRRRPWLVEKHHQGNI